MNALHKHHGSECAGIDPSEAAIAVGIYSYPAFDLWVGTATDINGTGYYDLVIFGFCLYLIDRKDLFRVVERADTVLKTGGHIAIHDFDVGNEPQVVPYRHKEGLYSYKMDYAKLWLANPAYRRVSKTVTMEGVSALTIIQKKSWRERCDHDQ